MHYSFVLGLGFFLTVPFLYFQILCGEESRHSLAQRTVRKKLPGVGFFCFSQEMNGPYVLEYFLIIIIVARKKLLVDGSWWLTGKNSKINQINYSLWSTCSVLNLYMSWIAYAVVSKENAYNAQAIRRSKQKESREKNDNSSPLFAECGTTRLTSVLFEFV